MVDFVALERKAAESISEIIKKAYEEGAAHYLEGWPCLARIWYAPYARWWRMGWQEERRRALLGEAELEEF